MPTPRKTNPTMSQPTRSAIDDVDQLASGLNVLKSHMSQASDLAEAGALASMFAHEVNNLMTQVGGRAQLALMHPDQPERATYALELACQASSQIAQLAELFMSTRSLTIKPGSFESISESHKRALSFLPEAESSIYQFTVSGNDTLVPGIPTVLLEQILLNLYLNAVRAVGDSPRKESGRITIQISTLQANHKCSTWNNAGKGRLPEQMIQIIIEDNGVGMSPDRAARLFDDKAQTDKEHAQDRGHGLGLAVCTKLLTSVQGSIRAESTPGVGTKMIVTLPIAQGSTRFQSAA